MKINCYQSYLTQEQKHGLDTGFIALDANHLSSENFREFGLYLSLFDKGVHLDGDYFGLFSHKFFKKSGLCSNAVFNFLEKNPGADLYLFNPYPQNAYYSFNIWEQGEAFHPGIIDLADELFKSADLGFLASTAPRMNCANLVYSNFWIGSSFFCNLFFKNLQKIRSALNSMDDISKLKYFTKTDYIVSDCCYFPFIMERFTSSFISNNNFKVVNYVYEDQAIVSRCLHPLESQIVNSFKNIVDSWDGQNEWSLEKRQIINGLCSINKAYYDQYFSHNDFPLL